MTAARVAGHCLEAGAQHSGAQVAELYRLVWFQQHELKKGFQQLYTRCHATSKINKTDLASEIFTKLWEAICVKVSAFNAMPLIEIPGR